jgi:hypothetical protein
LAAKAAASFSSNHFRNRGLRTLAACCGRWKRSLSELDASFRQAASYSDRILRGENPTGDAARRALGDIHTTPASFWATIEAPQRERVPVLGESVAASKEP